MTRERPSSDRTLLILDLDETLIHASTTELHRPADLMLFGYHIYRRPHLAEFLTTVQSHFDLAVWSSASDDYVRAVVDQIFVDPSGLKFVWGRSRATLRAWFQDGVQYVNPDDHHHYLKPLSKVRRAGWRLDRVLIVDDTPAKSVRNYGNAIYPTPYTGEDEDAELQLLTRYLLTIKDEANVRKLEKRGWRSHPFHKETGNNPSGT